MHFRRFSMFFIGIEGEFLEILRDFETFKDVSFVIAKNFAPDPLFCLSLIPTSKIFMCFDGSYVSLEN